MKDLIINVSDCIKLRGWKPEWADELFRLTDKNRKYLQQWLPWVPGVKTEEDSRKFILKSLKEQKKGIGLELSIWFQDKLVGCLGLHHLDKKNKKAAIGYWLDINHQGKGTMTLSVKALMKYSFQNLNLNRLEILAATQNPKSFTIAERLGFTKEGTLRETEFVNGRWFDYIVYSLLKREWKE